LHHFDATSAVLSRQYIITSAHHKTKDQQDFIERYKMKIFVQAFIVVIALFHYCLVASTITFINALTPTITTTSTSFLSLLSDASISRRHVLELLSKGTIISQSTIMMSSTTLSSDDSQDMDASPSTATTTMTSITSEEDTAAAAATAAAIRKQRMIERRQLMDASRSSNNRQSYLDLSKQRALLYNTTPKAITCPNNIPGL
jgi:hypothetical protein